MKVVDDTLESSQLTIIVDYKWKILRAKVWLLAAVYAAYLAIHLVWILLWRHSSALLTALFMVDCLGLLFELVRVKGLGHEAYARDTGNLAHCLALVSWIAFISVKLVQPEEVGGQRTSSLLALLPVLGTVGLAFRATILLKISPYFQRMLNFLQTLLCDAVPLIALFSFLGYLTCSLLQIPSDKSLAAAWREASPPTLLALLLLCVLLFCVLVSVVMDSYDRCQATQKSTEIKDKVRLMIAVEVLMIHQRDLGQPKYVHVFKYQDDGLPEKARWTGTTSAITKQMNNVDAEVES